MNEHRSRFEDGYIALISIIIIGAATMAVAITLLTTGTDAQRSVLVSQQAGQARQLSNACVEEALQKIHDLTSFTGSGSVTLGTGSCTYTVASTGASTRTIATTGTVGGVVRKAMVYVTINTSNISITSWQEVV